MEKTKTLYDLLEEYMLPPMSLEEVCRDVAMSKKRIFERVIKNAIEKHELVRHLLANPTTEYQAMEFLFSACGFAEYVKDHTEVNSYEDFPIEEGFIHFFVRFGKFELECETELKHEDAPPLAFGTTVYRTKINGEYVGDDLEEEVRRKIRPLTGTLATIEVTKFETLSRVYHNGEGVRRTQYITKK